MKFSLRKRAPISPDLKEAMRKVLKRWDEDIQLIRGAHPQLSDQEVFEAFMYAKWDLGDAVMHLLGI